MAYASRHPEVRSAEGSSLLTNINAWLDCHAATPLAMTGDCYTNHVPASKKNYGLKHLAVIMDGNRRWAKSRNRPSLEGHRAGVAALKNLVRICPEYGIKHLTAYTFSTENWNRQETEVKFLLELLGEVAVRELSSLKEENVRVDFIGDLSAFTNSKILNALNTLQESTKNNTGLHLHIALNYGSIDELERARKIILEELNSDQIKNINEELFDTYLYTKNVPRPEVVLRTGGEKRLSNFLLWQAAAAQLVFLDCLWPDFSESDLLALLEDYTKELSVQV